MRRFLVTMGVMALAALAPAVSHGDDQKIAESIIQRLQVERDGGQLAGFNINLEVTEGTVWIKGHVSEQHQQELVLDVARRVPGVKQVVNDIDVKTAAAAPEQAAEPQADIPSDDSETDLELPEAEYQSASTDRTPIEVEPFAFGSRDEIGSGLEVPESSTIPAIEPIAAAGPIPTTPSEVEREIAPAQATAPAGPSDQWIGQALVSKLGRMEQAGLLSGCELDLHVEGRSIYLEGSTASEQQRTAILEVARRIAGVRQVVNGIRVQSVARTAATESLAPATPVQASEPVMHVASQPVPVQGAFGGGPVPMHQPSLGGNAAVAYDHPQLPAYAWPAYASHPNYAALQYPRQYSPSTWPYIGPFYPYPQVPLGWRHVSLEWDDGWWFLDFHSRSR